jgi:hypothetical protein
MWAQLVGDLDHLIEGGCFSDKLDFGIAAEKATNCGPNDLGVVGQRFD